MKNLSIITSKRSTGVNAHISNLSGRILKHLLLLLLLITLSHAARAQVNPGYHKVNGYTRSNGTYVTPHYRTNPNATLRDNYSTYPNVNPHTGKTGTVRTTTYTAPATTTYSTPRTTTYSAPRTTYTAPRTTTYTAPRTNNYSAPRSTTYSAPRTMYGGKR
jgi:hypothetical protein